MARMNSLLWFVILFIRASRVLYPEQLLRMEKGLTTVRPSESMMRATWLRLALSISKHHPV